MTPLVTKRTYMLTSTQYLAAENVNDKGAVLSNDGGRKFDLIGDKDKVPAPLTDIREFEVPHREPLVGRLGLQSSDGKSLLSSTPTDHQPFCLSGRSTGPLLSGLRALLLPSVVDCQTPPAADGVVQQNVQPTSVNDESCENQKEVGCLYVEDQFAEQLFTDEKFNCLGDEKTSPHLADEKFREHLEKFREGGAFLIPENDFIKYCNGQSEIGRDRELGGGGAIYTA